MSPAHRAIAVATVLLALSALAVLPGAIPGVGAAPLPAAVTNPVTGNISGPRYIAINGTESYWFNGSGGPADIDGELVGNITWKATLTGDNLTGISISPNASTFKSGEASRANLTVGNVTETITLTVEVTSTYQGSNESINLTHQISIVVPYVVRAQLVAGTEKVLTFTVAILLDGGVVGNVTVPSIAAMGTYNLTFRYASGGLSAGTHTFTISLASEHGLVSFAGGTTTYSQSFYVAGPSPNYGVWAIVGIVVFVGVLFIFGSRVAARRRPTSK